MEKGGSHWNRVIRTRKEVQDFKLRGCAREATSMATCVEIMKRETKLLLFPDLHSIAIASIYGRDLDTWAACEEKGFHTFYGSPVAVTRGKFQNFYPRAMIPFHLPKSPAFVSETPSDHFHFQEWDTTAISCSSQSFTLAQKSVLYL